jgi:RHS repeat-associated protein
MYTAREWIADLQLYDYRHRFYNPDTGRFLQTDPTGFDAGDMNLFRYCGDDPMDRSDPMGLEEEYYRARVTAYGFGRDNAYAGHPEGGDAIAHTSDRSRREILPNGDTVSHAALGDGTFDHPSSVAVHPNSGIRMGSRVYVKGVGWFKVEDVCSTRMPTDTFDMWTGRSNPRQRAQLTGSRDVTVYGPKEAVPRRKRQLGPGARWNFMPRGDSRAAYPTSAVSSGGGVGDGGGGNSQATAEGDDRSFDTSRLVTELSVGNNSGEGFHPRGPR